MPGLNEKVILTIKLELSNILKDMSKLKKEIQTIQGAGRKREKEEVKHLTQQRKATKDAHRERKQQLKETIEQTKTQTKVVEGTTKAIVKQGKEVTKTGGVFERMGRSIQKYTSSPGAKRNYATAGAGARYGAGAIAGIGSGILNFVMQGLAQGYQTYLQVGAAKFGMAGMGGSRKMLNWFQRNESGNQLRGKDKRLRGGGVGGARLGFTPTETAGHGRMAGRAVGNIGAVFRAQQFALAGGGMDVGEATGVMGQLRQAGVGFGGVARPWGGGPGSVPQTGTKAYFQQAAKKMEGPKVLQKMIEAGMVSGIEKARLPEYLHAVSEVAQEVGTRQMGRVDVESIAQRMAWLSQLPGMTGQRSQDLTNKLDQMIKSPGGGEAGQALVLQSFGFGKPGGESTYYDAVKRQQRGFKGKGGAENLMDVLKETYTQYGVKGGGGTSEDQENANFVLSEISGLTLDQVEELGKVFNSSEDQKVKLNQVKELMEKTEPLEKQALNVAKEGFSGVKQRLAGMEAKAETRGAKIAKTAEKLQDLQQELLDVLANKLVPVLDKLMDGLERWFGKTPAEIKKGVEGPAAAAKQTAGRMKIRTAGDILQQQLQVTSGYKISKAAAAERGGTGVIFGRGTSEEDKKLIADQNYKARREEKVASVIRGTIEAIGGGGGEGIPATAQLRSAAAKLRRTDPFKDPSGFAKAQAELAGALRSAKTKGGKKAGKSEPGASLGGEEIDAPRPGEETDGPSATPVKQAKQRTAQVVIPGPVHEGRSKKSPWGVGRKNDRTPA